MVTDLFQSALVWFSEFLVVAVYVIGLLVTYGNTGKGVYPWYLASKAQAKMGTASGHYWFWKFRYQVARHLRRAAPRGDRDLFFKQHIRRFAAATGQAIPPEDVPGFGDIMRTLRLSGYEIRLLKSEKGANAAIAKEVRVLGDYIGVSETPFEAFLHYAVSMYLTLEPEDRKLVRLEIGGWARLTRDPVLSRILVEAFAPTLPAVVVALVIHFLR